MKLRCRLSFLALILLLGSPRVPAQGRWVVDVVQAGDAKSEREHDYAGEGAAIGTADGRPCRQADGWLRYSMKVYDDTEVTVVCLLRGSEGRRLVFDVVVDNQTVVTHTFVSPTAAPVTAEFRVPSTLTAGKTKIAVTLRAVNGHTPSVIELSIVQEHLE